MLRACNRVLKPGKKLVFYVIHFQPGVSAARRALVGESVPGYIDAPAPYRDLLEAAGFRVLVERDSTPEYHRTATAWLEEAEKLEPELRGALGDQVFEEKQARRRRSIEAMAAGDLGRTLFAARSHE